MREYGNDDALIEIYNDNICCPTCLGNDKSQQILQKYWPKEGKDISVGGIAIKNFYDQACENQNA